MRCFFSLINSKHGSSLQPPQGPGPCAVLCLVAWLHLTLCDPMDCSPPGSSVHVASPGKNTGVGCRVLLQGIFPTQGLNPGLPHCRWILYHLSHQGSPRTLEWVAYPCSRESSQSRNWTGVSWIAGRFFTSWAPRQAHPGLYHSKNQPFHHLLLNPTPSFILHIFVFLFGRRAKTKCSW